MFSSQLTSLGIGATIDLYLEVIAAKRVRAALRNRAAENKLPAGKKGGNRVRCLAAFRSQWIGAAVVANLAAGATVVITGSAMMLGFAVAAAVGIFFGFCPANKAARLKPIEALRYR